jgi:hypothetical protein
LKNVIFNYVIWYTPQNYNIVKKEIHYL